MKLPGRIAVKVGSNVLTRADGRLDISRMAALVDQIADLHHRGVEVLLISSGAVASGRGALPELKDESVTGRQLFAAVGQAKLIEHYYNLFQEFGITVGQILTTRENFVNKTLLANQKRCVKAMLDNRVVPVINENDVVSIEELMFTDNDELSALVSRMMKVELLVILTNVDGVFTGSPDESGSELIRDIWLDDDYSGCVGASKSSFGRGGMMTKMNTAMGVAKDGIEVRIANGRRQDILIEVLTDPDNALCTRFHPSKKPI
jgi:glutamate 5-kinase